MRQSRRHPQEKGPRPPEPGVNEAVEEVKVEVDESEAVAGAVEYAAEAGGGTAQPRELPVRGVEDVRDDEQRKPDDVGPAVWVREQVPGDEPDDERPQRHLVRRNPRRLERARDRSEEHTSELQSQSNLVCRLLLEKNRTGSVSTRCSENRALNTFMASLSAFAS